jgi:hypothetical protein
MSTSVSARRLTFDSSTVGSALEAGPPRPGAVVLRLIGYSPTAGDSPLGAGRRGAFVGAFGAIAFGPVVFGVTADELIGALTDGVDALATGCCETAAAAETEGASAASGLGLGRGEDTGSLGSTRPG